MTQDPWQCPLCGTVYAWWVTRCRVKHEPPKNEGQERGCRSRPDIYGPHERRVRMVGEWSEWRPVE